MIKLHVTPSAPHLPLPSPAVSGRGQCLRRRHRTSLDLALLFHGEGDVPPTTPHLPRPSLALLFQGRSYVVSTASYLQILLLYTYSISSKNYQGPHHFKHRFPNTFTFLLLPFSHLRMLHQFHCHRHFDLFSSPYFYPPSLPAFLLDTHTSQLLQLGL